MGAVRFGRRNNGVFKIRFLTRGKGIYGAEVMEKAVVDVAFAVFDASQLHFAGLLFFSVREGLAVGEDFASGAVDAIELEPPHDICRVFDFARFLETLKRYRCAVIVTVERGEGDNC